MKEETRITVKEIFCLAPKRSQVYQHCYEIRDLRIGFFCSNRISNRIGRPIRFRIESSNRIGRIPRQP